MTGRSPLARKPRWLRVPAPTSPGYLQQRARLRRLGINTVCESATCPNVGRCWAEGAAAFMILGTVCTRNCAFCDVPTGRPAPPDPEEPTRLTRAAAELGLAHVVITSVDRDDLADGGAGQFAACLTALAALEPAPAVEVLVPDFRGKPGALETVLAARPTVFNHNLETVARLYPTVRPAADYHHSLALLQRAGALAPGVPTKSGLMLGLGESREELLAALHDLRRAGVTILTLGQYLRPSINHHPVIRYWPPEEFAALKAEALALGFARVESHPLARSSYHAEALLADDPASLERTG